MTNQFISDSAAKGAAFLDRKALEKNTDTPILRGDRWDTGDKTKELININELSSGNLSHQDKNTGGTRWDKPPFKLIEYKKGFRNGVYHIDTTDGGKPKETWICDPLKVLAETRDSEQRAGYFDQSESEKIAVRLCFDT